jgi:hypothetical protein
MTPTPLTERLAELAKRIINECNEKCVLVDLEGKHLGFDPDDAYLLVEQMLISSLDSLLTAEGDKITCHLTREQFDLLWTSKLNPSVSLAAARRAGMEEACVQICGACMRFGPQSSQLVAGEWMHGLPPCTEHCKAAAIRKAMEEK